MKREELLPLLDSMIEASPLNPEPTIIDLHQIIRNQRVIMLALSYLIEHTTEQAWFVNPAPFIGEDIQEKPF